VKKKSFAGSAFEKEDVHRILDSVLVRDFPSRNIFNVQFQGILRFILSRSISGAIVSFLFQVS